MKAPNLVDYGSLRKTAIVARWGVEVRNKAQAPTSAQVRLPMYSQSTFAPFDPLPPCILRDARETLSQLIWPELGCSNEGELEWPGDRWNTSGDETLTELDVCTT